MIARIEGYCLGAGLEVAAACDLRVASADARFAMPEVRVGIPSVIEAALLPRLIGAGRARDLVLTGREVEAAEALAIGLVGRVALWNELDAAVDGWLDALLAAGPRALAAQKKLLYAWQELPLSESIARSIDAFAEAYESDEPAIHDARLPGTEGMMRKLNFDTEAVSKAPAPASGDGQDSGAGFPSQPIPVVHPGQQLGAQGAAQVRPLFAPI